MLVLSVGVSDYLYFFGYNGWDVMTVLKEEEDKNGTSSSGIGPCGIQNMGDLLYSSRTPPNSEISY